MTGRSWSRWAALDRVACKIVTEVPAQEVADRAVAAVEQARLQAEVAAVPVEVVARGMSMELAAEVVSAVATLADTEACPQCGAGGVKVAQIGTAVACGACLTLALQAVQ